MQVIDNAQPDTIAAAAKSQAIEHLDAPRPGASNRIELNSSKAPFNDARVREAFIHAVNVNAGIDSLFFGTAPRSYSPLSSVEPLALLRRIALLPTTRPRPRNCWTPRAGTTRDSEGYRIKDGKRLSLTFPVSTSQSIPAEQSLFEQMQATAKESGIEIKINLLDLSSWYGIPVQERLQPGLRPVHQGRPERAVASSSTRIRPSPHPRATSRTSSQVKDPALDELLDAAGSTKDEANERKDKYAQAQKLVLEGHYLLPLYDQQNHFLYSSKLKNVGATTAVATPTFFDTWLAK